MSHNESCRLIMRPCPKAHNYIPPDTSDIGSGHDRVSMEDKNEETEEFRRQLRRDDEGIMTWY